MSTTSSETIALAKRREFLHQRLREFCVGTDKQLDELKQKYQSDKTVMEKLNQYEPQIEP
jgi:hypothetical protein